MTSPFFGRQSELATLRRLLKKRFASFIVVRGRRRVGKSRLIAEFGRDLRTLSFVGLPPDPGVGRQAQMDAFARQMSQQLNMPLPPSNDWSDLFWYLAQQVQTGRVLIVLDEISWLGSRDPTFLPKLKTAWDQHFSKNPELITIACGSVSSWISKNILGSTGFVGRVSLDLVVRELPVTDCRLFWSIQQQHVSPYEIFKVLAVTGGIPKYLEDIDPLESAEDNLWKLCFRSDGLLYREFDQIFSDLFDKRAELYREIILALADGSATLIEIAAKTGRKKGGVLSGYLKDLILAGFVSVDPTWNFQSLKEARLRKFRLSDNYLRFYLKTIRPHQDAIQQEVFSWTGMANLPGWSSIMGLQFENLVLNNLRLVIQAVGIDLSEIAKVGPFFQRPNQRQQGCQIDMLIQTRHHSLYVCEIKFSQNEISSDVCDQVKEKVNRLSLPRRFSVRPVLIHVNGVSEGVQDKGYFSHIIDFSELLQGKE